MAEAIARNTPCNLRERRAPRIAVAFALAAATAHAADIELSLGNVEAPAFAAKAVTAAVSGKTFRLTIGELSALGRTWRNLSVTCGSFRLEPDAVECADGIADAGARIPIAFAWRPRSRTLDFTATPQPASSWRLRANLAEGARRVELAIDNAPLASLAQWLPAAVPKPGAGKLSAKLSIEGSERRSLSGTLDLTDAAFSDAAGLHAGEKLKGAVSLAAEEAPDGWRWRGTLEWTGGEVFWQPLYLRASAQTVRAEGTFDGRSISIARSTTTLPGVGEIDAALEWDRRAGRVQSADLRSGRLDAAALYARLLQPHFAGTALADLRVAGALQVSALRVRDAALEAMEIALQDLSFEDHGRRFAVFGANGRIPWHRTDDTRLDLEVKGGEVLRIPFGAVKLPLSMRGMRFRLESVEIPVLDGKLTVRGFATDPPGEQDWRWGFIGALAPVSLERLTQAFGWPTMHGTLSAEIPRVLYSESTLRLGGALKFRVFDGSVEARDVAIVEPFGRAPRLTADLDMRGLDLDLLTRTFSFGSITGRMDASVAGLELVDWEPVRFDARIASSPGDYPRKISQAAVQNITALGGAGASAAIQRTFLRFFEQFGYQKLGWSCRLEHGVCHMGGAEDSPQGYVIVKGSGIPALTVMGYNRSVNWQDLVERLKRVVRNNVHAVIH